MEVSATWRRSAVVWRAAMLSFVGAALAGHAAPGSAQAGLYEVHAGPDVASELELGADHRFRYVLSEGALDEHAAGHWRRVGSAVLLTTDPRPRPPRLIAEAAYLSGEWNLELRVEHQGHGIPGVHFVVGFDRGPTVSDYTQEDGWRLPASERRRPTWVRFRLPMFDFESERFEIIAREANSLRFQLEPNDLGVVDFRDQKVAMLGDQLVLHRRDRRLTYVRTAPSNPGR